MNITIEQIYQKMSELKDTVIFGELDNFYISEETIDTKKNLLDVKDVQLILDIFKDKHAAINLKSLTKDDSLIASLSSDISNELNIDIAEPWMVKYAILRRNRKINKK